MLSNKSIEKYLNKLKKEGKIAGWRGDYGTTAIFEFYQNNRPHWFWQVDIHSARDIDKAIFKVEINNYEH